MHGQKNIKEPMLESTVAYFFSYVNDARSHEPKPYKTQPLIYKFTVH